MLGDRIFIIDISPYIIFLMLYQVRMRGFMNEHILEYQLILHQNVWKYVWLSHCWSIFFNQLLEQIPEDSIIKSN